MKKKRNVLFLFVKKVVRLFYGKSTIDELNNIPDEPCIIVANHSQMHGPIIGELFFPEQKYMWCIGEVMNIKEVPNYAMKDFWPYKPKYIKWFYKLLSYLIAPLCSFLFNNAATIPVYKDSRIITTFKETVNKLEKGANIIIFPEHHITYNNIINEFQENFVDVAKLYYKRTGKEINFVPMYNCPKLKKSVIGKPIKFNTNNNIDDERKRICIHIKNEITNIAKNLPLHKVVPYANVKKKEYPLSK